MGRAVKGTWVRQSRVAEAGGQSQIVKLEKGSSSSSGMAF
jgi:hypothetical protein